MAQGYNLTVQLNLQGPKNLNNVVNNIKQKLNNIQATVNVKTSPQTQQALQGIANAAKGVKQASDDAANGMEKFGKSAGLAIKRFGAFTAATAGFYAITRATTQSLQRFIEYDRQITRVAQVTGTAKDSLEGLSSTITSLSTALGASSAELAQVSVTLSQAGLTAEQTRQALEALALTTLAPTFNDINQTVEGSIALMKQFSISSRELEGALGSINAVAGQFAVESSDIITAIQRTGGVFAAASNGVSQGTDALNEFIAVFTSVRATTRESAETIATGLRTIFTRLQREDTLEALKAFGIELTDLEGKFVGPYQAIQRLSEGLRTLDPRDVKFSSLVEELGGFRQVGKVIPLIQQFTTAQQALNVAQQGSGSLAKDAAIGQQSLGVQIAKVQQEFDALIRSIGETSEFKQFIRLSLDLASALIQIADAVKPLVPALTALGAVGLARGVPSIARGFKKGIGATGYYTGGIVRGPSGIDKVDARLTDGEYVIRRSAVQAIGPSALDQINKTGELPGFKAGGPIEAQKLGSVALRNRITRTGTKEQYTAGQRINDVDQLNFDIRSIPVDASPKIGNTEFEKRVAATVGGQWIGGDYPVDVLGPQGPIEVRNRQKFTPNAELLDKLIRHKLESKQNILSNTMGVDDINVGRIFVAYNTGKLDEEKRKELESEGRVRTLAPKSALKGAKKKGFDFRTNDQKTNYNDGGYNLERGEIDARLTAGEYVISAESARSLGKQKLDRLNKADRLGIPKFHTGGPVGYVPAFKGGGGVEGGGGIGSTVGLVLALQGAASLFSTSIEDAASQGAAEMGGSIQGAVSGINLGLIGGEIAGFIPGLSKFAGGIGLATAAVAGTASAFIQSKNATIDFANKLSKQRIEDSTQKVSSALDKLSKDANNFNAFRQAVTGIRESTREIGAARSREIESTRLGFGNLPEYLLGSRATGERTQEQTAAGTSQEMLSAQRSLVLEMRGFGAYLNTLGGYLGDNEQAQQNLANSIRQINERRAQESSREFAGVADSITQLVEQRLREGVKIDQIINSGEFKSFAEALARANPAVEKFILNTQANTSLSAEEKQQRIDRVVAQRAEIEIIQRTAAVRQQIEINNAERIGRTLETVLTRVFQNFEQIFNRTAIEIGNAFSTINTDIAALSGNASIGLGSDRNTNILSNPLAYSQAQFSSVVSGLKPILGDQAETIGALARGSAEIEGKIISAINTIVRENPGATDTSVARLVGEEISGIVADLNLPPDVARVLSEQISAGIQGLRSKGKDKIGLDSQDVRESVSGFASTIDTLKGSMDTLLAAQKVYHSGLEQYTKVMNNITGLLAQRNQFAAKSLEILAQGAINLEQAFGRIYSSAEIQTQQQKSIERQTFGLSDPNEIFDKIIDLNSRRQALQTNLQSAQDQGPAGFAQFRDLSVELVNTNVELNNMQQALQTLANSSNVAQAALSEISRVQQQREQQAGFLESVVSSTPEQMQALNQAYSDLQRLLSGQSNTIYTSIEAQKAYAQTLRQTGNYFQAGQAAQGVLAQERGNVTSLVRELAPFLGSSQEANKLRADVLGRQLSQLGLLTPQFAKIVESIRNPQGDPQLQEAIRVYREAVTQQSRANQLLGQIQAINATIAEKNSAQAVVDGLTNTVLTVNVNNTKDIAAAIQPAIVPQPIAPQARANGGVIYAAAGQPVEMKSRGTDTVPAMLTPGEFVVNRQATAKNRGLLESINSGKTQYYQYGGFVSSHFDPNQSRGTTTGPLVPIEQWQEFRNRYNSKLYTNKDFTNFTTNTGTTLEVADYLPQTVGGDVVSDVSTLKEKIYNSFSTSAIVPGSVPELVVEKTGAFNADLPSTFADFGTATRIAKAVKELQKTPNYSNIKLDSPTDIVRAELDGLNIVRAIETQSGIPKKVIQGYLTPKLTTLDYATGNIPTASEQPSEGIQIYLRNAGAFQPQEVPIEQYGLYAGGFNQPPVLIPDANQKIDEQNFARYRRAFSQSTNFVKNPPNLGNIKQGAPSSAPDGNNSWTFSDGSFYGLYSSLGAEPNTQAFGPSVNAVSGYVYGKGYNITSGGGSGTRIGDLSQALNPNDVLAQSQQISETVNNTRDIIGDGLILDPQVDNFANALESLYGGSKQQEQLTQFARFFNNKNTPIVGLSSSAYRSFNRMAAEEKQPRAIRFDLNNKNLGLLRTDEQIDFLRDRQKEIEEGVKKEAEGKSSILSGQTETIPLTVDTPIDKRLANIPARIRVPFKVPYKQYAGNLYDEQMDVYQAIQTKGIVPDYANYRSFLKGNSNNDLLYGSRKTYLAQVSNNLAKNRAAISRYLFSENAPLDTKPFLLQSSGYQGSSKPNVYSAGTQGLYSRQFIADGMKRDIDAAKNKLLKPTPFEKPTEQKAEDEFAVKQYNDMFQDTRGYFGRVPAFRQYVAMGRAKPARNIREAKGYSSGLAGKFAGVRESSAVLPVRAMGHGFSQAFDGVGTGILNPWTDSFGRVNTMAAATSFGQSYWFQNHAGDLPLEQQSDPATVQAAQNAIDGGNPKQPATIKEWFDLYMDPYLKYNTRGVRTKGLSNIYRSMVNQSYYETQRRGPVPSAAEAGGYYSNLISWYDGINRWPGQDGISEEITDQKDIKEKARYLFRTMPNYSNALHNMANRSHLLLGGGIYGSIPTFDQISLINGVNPRVMQQVMNEDAAGIPQLMSRGGEVSPLYLAEGGQVLLDRALRQQATIPQAPIPLMGDMMGMNPAYQQNLDAQTYEQMKAAGLIGSSQVQQVEEAKANVGLSDRQIALNQTAKGNAQLNKIMSDESIPYDERLKLLKEKLPAVERGRNAARVLDPKLMERERQLEIEEAGAIGLTRTLPGALAATALSATGFGLPVVLGGAITAGISSRLAEGVIDPEGANRSDRISRENPLASTLGSLAGGLGVQSFTAGTLQSAITSTMQQRGVSVLADFVLGEGLGQLMGGELSSGSELAASAMAAFAVPGGGKGDEKAAKEASGFFTRNFPTLTGALSANPEGVSLANNRQDAVANINAKIAELIEGAPKAQKLFGRGEGAPVLDASTKAEIAKLKELENRLYSPSSQYEAIEEALVLQTSTQRKPAVEAGDVGGAGKTPAIDPQELTSTGRYKLDTTIAASKTERTAQTGKAEPPAEIQEILDQGRQFYESRNATPTKDTALNDAIVAQKTEKMSPELEKSMRLAEEFATERTARQTEDANEVAAIRQSQQEQAALKQKRQEQDASAAALKQQKDRALLEFAQEQKINPRIPPGVDKRRFNTWYRDRNNPAYKDVKDAVINDVLARAEFRQAQIGEVPNRIPGVDRDLFQYGGGNVVNIGPEGIGPAALQASSNYRDYKTIAQKIAEKEGGPFTIIQARDMIAESVGLLNPDMPDLEKLAKRGLFPSKAAVGTTLAPNQEPGKPLPSSPLEVFEQIFPEYKATGGIVQQPKYLATGGQAVAMTPRGTDTVPAMLTPGEFVVNRESAQKNMGLLKAINRSKGGITPAYLQGGGLTQDQQNLVNRMGIPQFRLADGINPRLADEVNLARSMTKTALINQENQKQFRTDENSLRDPMIMEIVDQYFNNPGNLQPNNEYGEINFDSLVGGVRPYIDTTIARREVDRLGSTNLVNALFDTGVGQPKGTPGQNVYAGRSEDDIKALLRKAGYMSKGGRVNYLQEGGQLVDYSPKGTDTIPAMLTPGEFVVNREATQKNLGLLKAINKSSGGVVRNGVLYAANGGPTIDETRAEIAGQRAFDSLWNAIGSLADQISSFVIPSPQQQVVNQTVVQAQATAPVQMQPSPATDCCDRIIRALENRSSGEADAPMDLASITQTLFSPFTNLFGSLVGTEQNQPVPESNMTANNDVFASIRDMVFGQPAQQTETAPITPSTTAGIEAPAIDFSVFTQGVATFGSFSAPLTSAIQTLSQVDFGVINNGAASMLASSISLGGSFGRFNDSVNTFSQETNKFINELSSINLNGSITVGGNISVQPMTVNIEGLEAIEQRLAGFAAYINSALAQGLAQANPGINIDSLQTNYTPSA